MEGCLAVKYNVRRTEGGEGWISSLRNSTHVRNSERSISSAAISSEQRAPTAFCGSMDSEPYTSTINVDIIVKAS